MGERMTPEEVNREIAEKVMKLDFNGDLVSFNPMHRIEYGMLVLEKFPYWELGKDEDGYYCVITLLNESTAPSGRARTKEEAICLAALEAVEEEE